MKESEWIRLSSLSFHATALTYRRIDTGIKQIITIAAATSATLILEGWIMYAALVMCLWGWLGCLAVLEQFKSSEIHMQKETQKVMDALNAAQDAEKDA